MARSKKKKWKSRIKKALKLAAIGGAGYLAAKRFGGKKATVADTAASEDANIGVTHSALTDNAPVIKTDAVATDTAPKKVFLGNSRLQRDGMGPNESVIANRLTAGNRVPPSMRGGALHAQGYTPRHIGTTHPRIGNITGRYKKGGSVKKARVTGAAKRGFGRALMKGKK